MSNTFQFELVSPEKILVSKPAVMVTVPGGEGDYGVLVGHAPMITTVKAGVIDVYANDDVTVSERIFVAGGVAEVTAERCTVLAEEAMSIADIDRAKVESSIKDLTEDVSAAKSDAERKSAEDKLAIAQAKITALAA